MSRLVSASSAGGGGLSAARGLLNLSSKKLGGPPSQGRRRESQWRLWWSKSLIWPWMRDNCNKTPKKKIKNHKKIFLWCSEKKMCIINISYKRHFFSNITLIFREEKPTLQNFHNRHYSNLSLVLGKWNQFCKSTKSLPLSPLLYYYFIPLNM